MGTNNDISVIGKFTNITQEDDIIKVTDRTKY